MNISLKENLILNDRNKYALLLVFFFTIFSYIYVRHVIMPQQGWWHYFAWRVLEGEVLYKDIFLFIPPYFTFFTTFLYKLFSNEFFKYTLFIGYPIKIACLLIMYYTLTKITTPLYSCISVLCGACIGATYLTDVWYDYNPILMLPCLLICWLSMEMYEFRHILKKICVFSFFMGLFVGILLMSKQSIGLAYFFAGLILYGVLFLKEDIIKSVVLKAIGAFCLGLFVGILPGIAYFVHYDCLDDFIRCMKIATEAKGGGSGLFGHLVSIMTQWKKWLLAVPICIFIFWESLHLDINIKFNKRIRYLSFILSVSIVIALYLIFNKIKPVLLIVGLFLLPVVSEIYVKEYGIVNFNKKMRFCFFVALLVVIYIWASINSDYHAYIYNRYHVFGARRLVISVLSYVFTIIWIKEILCYFSGSRKNAGILVFMSMTYVHFLTGIISTSVFEELFMLMYIPWTVAYLFNVNIPFKIGREVFIMILSACCVLTCITSKTVVPYDWQGWKTTPIRNTDINSSVNGLEGHLVSSETNEKFLKMTNMIKQHTAKGDKVYQFANIPLFNVLSEREIPAYGVISWFDVLPDKVSIADAEELYKNPPQMVVWHNMTEDQWVLLENVFRNGKRSGQREIKKFYDDIVLTKYEKIYSFSNNRDGNIELFLLNEKR